MMVTQSTETQAIRNKTKNTTTTTTITTRATTKTSKTIKNKNKKQNKQTLNLYVKLYKSACTLTKAIREQIQPIPLTVFSHK